MTAYSIQKFIYLQNFIHNHSMLTTKPKFLTISHSTTAPNCSNNALNSSTVELSLKLPIKILMVDIVRTVCAVKESNVMISY